MSQVEARVYNCTAASTVAMFVECGGVCAFKLVLTCDAFKLLLIYVVRD